jgi:antitoxin (DNA-binding transcriptional repressor) of toxin-antitoxin stability system
MADEKIMQSRDLQRHSREILDAILKGRHVHITRYNRPHAIMVPPDWYEQASRLMAAAEQDE